MSEEEKAVEQETENLETENEDVTETPEEENTEESTEEQEQEVFENDSDYLKAHGIEGDNLDEIMKDYRQLKAGSVALQQQQSTQPQAPPQASQAPASTETLFARNVYTKATEEALIGQTISDEDKAAHLASAAYQDRILNGVLGQVEEKMTILANVASNLQQSEKDGSWNRFHRRYGDIVQREALEPFMQSGGHLDYNKALLAYAMDRGDMKMIAQITENKKPTGKQPKLRRSSATRRTSPRATSSKVDWKHYINKNTGELDDSKIQAIPDKKKRNAIIEAAIAATG